MQAFCQIKHCFFPKLVLGLNTGTILLLVLFSASVAQDSKIDSVVTIIRPVFETDHELRLTFIKHPVLSRPRVGLALSGGGSRCLSQIGVLQVFEENNIPIDYIVGTSMGCVLGGLYAAGYTPQELADLVKNIQWTTILNDRPPRRSLFLGQKQERDRLLLKIRLDGYKPYIPPALTPGQRLHSILTELTMQADYVSAINFDEFRVPFRAIATDLYTGKKVVLADGDLAEAMSASLAFPLLFTPVPVKETLLVDGGLVDNIPVDELRNFSTDITIAVDVTSNLRGKEQLHAPWEIADQVTSIMQRDRNEQSRREADILIRLDDSTHTNMDFSGIDELINAGRKMALAQIPAIRALLAAQEQKILNRLPDQEYAVDEIKISPEIADDTALSLLPAVDGHPITMKTWEIVTLLETIYRANVYSDVWAEIDRREDRVILQINAKANPVLRGVVFKGNTVFAEPVLQKQIDYLVGKQINHAENVVALQEVMELYRQAGFSLAQIVAVDFDDSSDVGTVTIDEGRIHAIFVDGLEKTRQLVVLREFPLKKGDIFNFNRAKQGLNNIYGTALFDRVGISLQRKTTGAELRIKLQEKKYHVLRLSGRFDFERKGRGFIEFSDENVKGTAAKLTMHAEYGSRDWGLKSKLLLERIFKTYLTLTAEGYFTSEKDFIYQGSKHPPVGEYTEYRLGGYASLGQLVKKLGILSVEIHSDRFNLEPITGSGFPTGISVVNRLTFHSVVDTRDDLPFPSRGRFVEFFYDASTRGLNSENSFFRLFGHMETFNTIGSRHTINPRFLFGTSDRTTPFVFHFRMGGPDQLFGLRDREWIGRNFVLFNFGYRFRVPGKLPAKTFIGLRYDLGGIWQNAEDANYKKFHHAIGGYLGFDTFIGAIELAYGRLDTGQKRVYLSLGYKF